jgi:hypothetical protein
VVVRSVEASFSALVIVESRLEAAILLYRLDTKFLNFACCRQRNQFYLYQTT